MSNEREPLWSDERIDAQVEDFDMGENERNLARHIRDDYEARIAELEQELAQTWQPVGHFKRACTCRDCRNLYGMENESLLTIQAGNNISNILSVVLPDNIRLCRLVERAEVQPTEVDHE